MDLRNQRIVLTGAGGGIGRILSEQLTAKGVRLCRLVRQLDTEPNTANLFVGQNSQILTLACDVAQASQRDGAVRAVERAWGGIDVLINLAGVLDFKPFQEEDPAMLHRMIQVNVEAPMQLARAILPGMLERGHGRIVNVGSMFGSIGFPYFAAYSATKFALRGYSQALRRELAGTGVGVTYVSPRAVNTPLNPPVVHEMAARGMMHMDEPEPVARAIVKAIEKERSEAYLGFPESFFARLNAIFPGLVDKALAKQTPSLHEYAAGQNA
jgi:short-subunit dehydrogenase